MKPQNIFLVRHGESVGNIDKDLYKTLPDYAMSLTPNGRLQANEAGIKLKQLIRNTECAIYYSPFFRARETADCLLKHINYNPDFLIEEPRLREQEWAGRLREDGHMEEVQEERDAFGHFYFRFQGGESCADVYDRISDFFNTLHRDFEKSDFPENCIISSHGMTNRLFLMRWFHLSVEEFQSLANPTNGETWHLKLNEDPYSDKRKYTLLTPLRKYETAKCKFEYPFKGILKNNIKL